MSLRETVHRVAEALAPFERIKQDKAPQILIIDDDEVHRGILSKVAQRAGFVAIEAKDCADVVRQTLLNDFDCATLDLSLGEREGTEVLLHFSICGFRAPVIILSGAEADIAGKAYDLGKSLDLNMLPAVSKPVDLAALREQLTGLAQEWTARRAKANAA